jgi:hypothetical protein
LFAPGINVCGCNLNWKDELSFEVFYFHKWFQFLCFCLIPHDTNNFVNWTLDVHLVPYPNISYLIFEIDAYAN